MAVSLNALREAFWPLTRPEAEAQPARWTFPMERVLLGLTAVLGVAALLPASSLKLLVIGTLGGVPVALALRDRFSALELLLVGPALSLATYCLLSPLLVVAGHHVVSGLVPAALAGGLAHLERRRRRTLGITPTAADAVALVLVVVAAIPVRMVFATNGLTNGGFETRAWFGRDGYWFFAFAQMALERGALPTDNPFVTGAPNTYGWLLHGGAASLWLLGGQPVALAGCLWTPVCITFSFGLSVMAAFRLSGAEATPRAAAVVGVCALAAAMVRPDLFLYPQTQVFGFSLLLLGAWWWKEPWPLAALAAVAVFGHAVTAAGLLALLVAHVAHDLFAQERRRALLLLGVLVVLAGIFVKLSISPHPGARVPISGFAAVRSTLVAYGARWWLANLVLAVACVAAIRRGPWALVPLGLFLLGAAYRVQALTDGENRWFADANAERFIVLGMMLLPATVAALQPVPGTVVAAALGVALVLVQDLQGWRAGMQLTNDPPQRLEAADLELFERVRAETPKDARFLTLEMSLALPAFTGRAQGPVDINVWAVGSMANPDFNARLTEMRTFAHRQPHERLSILAARGYTHVLWPMPQVGGEAQAFADQAFGPGAARVVAANGRRAVLEVTRR